MDVYANSLTEEAIKREFAYAFSDKKYPGIPNLNLITIDENPFTIGDIPVIPILVWHLKMPVLGFRFGQFTYITDANRIEDHEKEKIKGSDAMVLNALRKAAHISHFTLDEAVAMVQELNVPAGYFTHISHQMGRHEEVNAILPKGVQLAFDGQEICFDQT
jgi:phosphoribosyl 1,2-cyclic phosphate phosphodiesterase